MPRIPEIHTPDKAIAATAAEKTAEKEPDFAELQKEKERLFKKIESESLKLDVDEKGAVVRLVSGFSIKDGFEMAKLLGFKGFDYFLDLTTDENIQYKNKNFYNKFASFLNQNKKFFCDESIESLVDDFGKEKKMVNEDLHPIKLYQAGTYPYPPDSILKEVEDYYFHFIRNRHIKSRELPKDDRTQVERTAEDHLLSAEAMLNESYYTGPVREALGLSTESDIETSFKNQPRSDVFLTEDEAWALRGNVISRQMVDGVLDGHVEYTLGDREKFYAKLKRARYAPSKLLFEERKRGAEKGLVKQIKQSLIMRGFKEDEFEIKLNEKGEYEAVEKESVDEPEQAGVVENGKENFKPAREVFNYTGYKEAQYYLSEVDISEGSLYVNYRKFNSTQSLIVDEHGNSLNTFYDAHSIRKVAGHEVFIAREKAGQDSELIVDSQPLLCEDVEVIPESSRIVNIGEHLYWYGYQKIMGGVNHKIVKDKNIEYHFAPNDQMDGDLHVIGGKLTFCVVKPTEDERKCYIEHGSETFGPYNEIKLCENSTDKLVFYARKEDRHFVYVDGVEKELEFNYTLDVSISRKDPKLEKLKALKVVDCNGDIFIHFKTSKWDVIFSIKNTNQNAFYADKFSNLQNIDGIVSWISYDSGEWRFHVPGNGTIPINIETGNNNVVEYKGSIFVSDGKKILTTKFGENRFDKLSFDGEIELIKSGGKLFVIESLPDAKRVWEYDEKGELKLNEHEQRDLDLANAVTKEDLPTIDAYFKKYYQEKNATSAQLLAQAMMGIPIPNEFVSVKGGLKSMYEQSQRFVGAVNQTIKDVPELFMDTFRAKDDKPTEYLMTQMFYYMFPEAQARREQALRDEKRKGMFGGLGGGSGREGRNERDSTFNYDQGSEGLASLDESGYYEMVEANREVLRLREPLPSSTFIASNTFGKHSESGWTRVNVPLDQEIQDPAKETTFEFVDEKSSQTINLPRIAGSKIITERLKGVTAKNTEIPVKIIEENNQGEVRVNKGHDAKRLTYSMSYSEAPKTMAEVTQRDYDKFRADFERSFGDVMTEPVGDLGDELDIFVRGLKDKSPREQVIAIQEFCYEYGYYNLDKEPRDTNSFEERLSIMEGRMDELKEKDPNLAHKLYAGICTDFATLTAALLRKAGFVSGISTGFVPEAGSTSIKTAQAHAVSYVLWPSTKAVGGKPDMIIVDGTPSNVTPKIVEQEKKAAEIHKELGVDAEKELAKLEHILKMMDAEAIKKLDNGVLEKTLNQILYGVRQSHVDVMDRVLNASRYAGFDLLEMERGNLEDQIEFRKFMEEEIYKEKSAAHENRERRGEELFNMMLEFARRFEKDKNIRNKSEALDVLDKVFDIAGKYLDPIEDRSAAAVITYLRARKMR